MRKTFETGILEGKLKNRGKWDGDGEKRGWREDREGLLLKKREPKSPEERSDSPLHQKY